MLTADSGRVRTSSPWNRWNGAVRPTWLVDEQQDHRFKFGDLKPGCRDARCVHGSAVARRQHPGGLDHTVGRVHADLKRPGRLTLLGTQFEDGDAVNLAPIDGEGAVTGMSSRADPFPRCC